MSSRGGGGGFGGQQPNMQQLMKQAQKMQQQLEAAQAELAEAEVTGTRRRRAGDGHRDRLRRAARRSPSTPRRSTRTTSRRCRTWSSPRSATPTAAAGELAAEKMGPLTGGGGLGGLGLPGF